MTDTQDSQRLAYSPQEAADLIGVSAKTIYREVKAGNLIAKKVGQGRAIRISHSSIIAYLESNDE